MSPYPTTAAPETTVSEKIIGLVGASGHLGGLIAEALLENADVRLRLLVRPESRVSKAFAQDVGEVHGGSIAEKAAPKC